MTIDQARNEYPEFHFIKALQPSAQKAAFHVRDSTGHDLCLKIISPNYCLDRLHREVKTLQEISHPNVVRMIRYAFSTSRDTQRHYIIEEFIDGSDLSELLESSSPWELAKCKSFYGAFFGGLGALHEKHIVHRDLKPSNIRVKPNGTPVIIDFGLTRHLDLPDITNTEDGAEIGTRMYFSPEQCQGNKYDIDQRTDMFAAGTILYQTLTGLHPFWKPNMPVYTLYDNICNGHNHFTQENFTALPNRWKLLIRKLLEKKRVNRPYNTMQILKYIQLLEV